jgi:transketolase
MFIFSEVIAEVFPVPLERVGIRDAFAESGEPEGLAQKYALDSGGIREAVVRAINRKNKHEHI